MKREVPLILITFAFALSAQVRFDVPKLGYVHDREAKAIRLVSGIPGAASLEGSMESGGAIERAWISPRGYALTQGKLESAVRYFDWSSGARQDLMDAASSVAISQNGRYFALAGDGSVELWDASSSPARLSRFDAAGVKSVAVSDDGQAALVLTQSGLSLWQRGQLQQIWAGESMRGADFLPASRDFAAYDGARNKVLAMRGGAMTEWDAATSGATVFALSADGRSAVLGGERNIEILNFVSGASSILAVDSAVEELARAGNGEMLQVRLAGATRTMLLEWAGLAAPQLEVLVGGGAQ